MNNKRIRPITIISVCVLSTLLLTGCFNQNNPSSQADKEQELQRQILLLEQQVADLTKKNEQFPKEEDETNKQMVAWYEQILRKLTTVAKPEFEIIPGKVGDLGSIVFVKDSPKDYEQSGILLLRLALEFPNSDKVTFWRDLQQAEAYASTGKKNDEDLPRSLIGEIKMENDEWALLQYGSSSGPSHISFGKFVRPK